MSKFTTKRLRQRFFNGSYNPLSNHDPNITCNNENKFLTIKKMTHPKEREIEFLRAHDALLTNHKLFEIKLIDSPLCNICNVVQDVSHIFVDCSNAKEAQISLDSMADRMTIDKLINTSIRPLVNRILFNKRNSKIKADLFCTAINNRIDDHNKIAQ